MFKNPPGLILGAGEHFCSFHHLVFQGLVQFHKFIMGLFQFVFAGQNFLINTPALVEKQRDQSHQHKGTRVYGAGIGADTVPDITIGCQNEELP